MWQSQPVAVFRRTFVLVCHALFLWAGYGLRVGFDRHNFDGGSLADVGAEAFSKRRGIVRVHSRILRSAGYGDVGESGIDQSGMCRGVHVDEDTVGRQSLGAVGSHGVAVVEMAHPQGIEGKRSALLAVQADGHGRPFDLMYRTEVPILYVEVGSAGGELEAVSDGEVALELAVGGDALQSFRVVGDVLSIWTLYREPVLPGIDGDDGSVTAPLDPKLFAAAGVIEEVAGLVLGGPTPVGACKLRALGEHVERSILFGECAGRFQFLADGFVDVATAGVLGRDNQRVRRVCGVVLGDGFAAPVAVGNLGDAALRRL